MPDEPQIPAPRDPWAAPDEPSDTSSPPAPAPPPFAFPAPMPWAPQPPAGPQPPAAPEPAAAPDGESAPAVDLSKPAAEPGAQPAAPPAAAPPPGFAPPPGAAYPGGPPQGAAWGGQPPYPYPQQHAAPGYGPYPPPGGHPGYPGYPAFPGYPGYPGYPMAPGYPGPNNGVGTAAMVLGIVGTVLSISCFGTVLGFIASIAAVICGSIGLRNVRRGEATNRTQARSGLVLGIIGLVLAVAVGVIFAVMAAKGAFDDSSDGHSDDNVGTAGGSTASGPIEPGNTSLNEPLKADQPALYPGMVRATVTTPVRAPLYDAEGDHAWRFTVVFYGGLHGVDARAWDVDAYASAGDSRDLGTKVITDQIPSRIEPGRAAAAVVVVLVPPGHGTADVEVTPGAAYDDAYWSVSTPKGS